jgi:membrane protein YdbS with pleckstrin-like domain
MTPEAVRIKHNGAEMGPYSLDEARRLVLAGDIPATSPAIFGDANKWKPLNQHAEFVGVGKPERIDPGVLANAAGLMPQAPLAEKVIWEGSPSAILTLPTLLGWILFIALLVVLYAALDRLAIWPNYITHQQAMLAIASVAALGFVIWIGKLISLRSVTYRITSQRVRVTNGLLAKSIQEIELFRVKDTSAGQSFSHRLFGVGNIEITSGDSRHPVLNLRAVPDAVRLREKIRERVMSLRQSWGVRELDVM